MINLDTVGGMPQALLAWFKWVSPVRYGFNGIAAAQFTEALAEEYPLT